MSKKNVAIVGKPNVGKSTMFNMLIGEKLSIVADTPGVTRDRIYGDCEWNGVKFQLIDTGGIEPDTNDTILASMRRQALLAMDMADSIIFVVDIKTGITPQDEEVAQLLRRTKKNVILVCNKVDNVGKAPDEMYEFYNLGLGEVYPISSRAKLGIGELLDAIVDSLKGIEEDTDVEEYINVAFIGKPNVGKSSVINNILKEDRHIVSDIAGTTRDAVDSKYVNKFGKYNFIDTAGIRRKNKVIDEIEKYSIVKAKAAIERADVAVIVIDAMEGATDQDEKIAGIAHELGKGLIIAINKWDKINKAEMTVAKYTKILRQSFKFMQYAPIVTISALTNLRITSLFDMINKVHKANTMRIPTGVLNDIIIEALAIHPAPTDKGRRLKIYYATQVKTKPPTFVLFVNNRELAHFSYIRYIENALRSRFDFEGTPIVILTREKNSKEE